MILTNLIRLVKIIYYNTKKNKKLFEKYSFIIEDESRAAKRNDAKVINTFHYPFDINIDNEQKMYMFQYMVGNKDYWITTQHNIVLMQPKDTIQPTVAVPYDFDWSAFIDAAYTKPKGVPEEMLENRRIYKGMCHSEEEFMTTVSYFDSLKSRFQLIIDSNEQLGKYPKKVCMKYIQEFYDIIHDKESFKTNILNECMTRKDYIQFE